MSSILSVRIVYLIKLDLLQIYIHHQRLVNLLNSFRLHLYYQLALKVRQFVVRGNVSEVEISAPPSHATTCLLSTLNLLILSLKMDENPKPVQRYNKHAHYDTIQHQAAP